MKKLILIIFILVWPGLLYAGNGSPIIEGKKAANINVSNINDVTGIDDTTEATIETELDHDDITGAGTVDTAEEVQDAAGGMVTENTETRITVTYQESDGTIDYVVDAETDPNAVLKSTFTGDSQVIVGTGNGTYQKESGATLRTSLGLGMTDTVQFNKINITGNVNTDASSTGFSYARTKNAGVTDSSDDFLGITTIVRMDQVGGILGGLRGVLSLSILYNGTVSTVDGYSATAQIWGGSVNVVNGIDNSVYIDTPAIVTGSVYGLKSNLTVNSDPSGTVYGLYLDENGSYIDYGIYQDGTAPNLLGGNLSIGSGTGELTAGSINRASGSLTLEIGGTAEQTITSTETTFGGGITASAVYSHNMNGETIRALQINSSGELGYDSSSLRYKTNIKDISDTSWIYILRPVDYEPKKKIKQDNGSEIYADEGTGTHRQGLIAEEVEKINPEYVFYNDLSDGSKEVEGVHYDRLITPLLAEIQKLKKRIDELEKKLPEFKQSDDYPTHLDTNFFKEVVNQ